MDIVLCILFGLLSAGITASLFENSRGPGLKFVFTIGLVSGAAAALIGLAGGWGDLQLFNLYNVMISIGLAGVATLTLQTAFSKRNKALGVSPQAAE
jgi:hypothetical protein